MTNHPNRSKGTAESNIKACPSSCALPLLSTGQAIVILNGETGYHDAPQLNGADGKADQFKLDTYNASVGAHKGHIEAMQAGSMFGWHVPAADPTRWDENGKLIRKVS